MLLSPLKATMCGHKMQDSYVRGEENSFVVKHKADIRRSCFCTTNFLFVSVSHASVSHYEAEVITLLICSATSLRQGIFVALSVGQLSSSISVVFSSDNTGQEHHVQLAGKPGKENRNLLLKQRQGLSPLVHVHKNTAWERGWNMLCV